VLHDDLQRWVTGGFPSLSVAVATSCGVVWSEAAGEADMTRHVPASTSSLYGIGSITKPFVAVVILQLADEGRLRLNQTPADILDRTTVWGVPNAMTATLAELMNHTSGIPSWEEDEHWLHQARNQCSWRSTRTSRTSSTPRNRR
jgi:D-alanyl-D-alanine carboxypeptidase